MIHKIDSTCIMIIIQQVNENIPQSFLQRRSNLRGIKLMSFTEVLGAYNILKVPASLLKLEKAGNTDVYDATEAVEGAAIDAFHILEKQLNFTISKQLIRKDRQFGTFLNGTFLDTF